MLTHQKLTISGPNDKITQLIFRLKELKSPFFLLSKLSKEYAANIFLEEGDALCLKTNRKSLQESKIWLVKRDQTLEITNITADRNLTCSEYNAILKFFATQVIERLLPEQCIMTLTEESESLEKLMSVRSYTKLNEWLESCNIEKPISHDLDLKMWVDFVVSVYKYDQNLNLKHFKTELAELKPSLSKHNLDDLENKLQYSLDFLKIYNENR